MYKRQASLAALEGEITALNAQADALGAQVAALEEQIAAAEATPAPSAEPSPSATPTVSGTPTVSTTPTTSASPTASTTPTTSATPTASPFPSGEATQPPFISSPSLTRGKGGGMIAQLFGEMCIRDRMGTCYQLPCLFGLVKSGGDISFVFKNDTIFVFLVVLPSALIASKVGAAPWVVFACLKCDQILKMCIRDRSSARS